MAAVVAGATTRTAGANGRAIGVNEAAAMVIIAIMEPSAMEETQWTVATMAWSTEIEIEIGDRRTSHPS